MENEERLKFKLRVEQIKKNLIEFRYPNKYKNKEFRKCPKLTR